MHERTRKRICRTAFFVLCLAPTAMTAAWAAYQNRPAAPTAAAQRLGRAIDCNAIVSQLTHPRPGVHEASQITLQAPGSQQPDVSLDEIRWQDEADLLAANIDRVGLRTEELANLLTIAGRWLNHPRPCELRARSLVTVCDDAGAARPFRLRQIRLRSLLPADGSVQVQVVAAAAGESTALKLQAKRTQAGRLSVELDAAQTSIPLALATIGTPLAGLAPESQFTGVVRWEIDEASCRGTLHGQIVELDLADLLPEAGPHLAEGDARLTVESLEFAAGQLVRLSGRLESNGGMLSRSLLVAAARCLYCSVPSELAVADPQPFDALGVEFVVDAEGLTIRGLLSPGTSAADQPGALARHGAQELLVAPRAGYERLPPVFLAQFIAGVHEHWNWHWLPAAPHAARLFALLPSQRATPPDDEQATSPESQ